METITKPQVIAKPFCDTGDKNTIPTNATGSQLASLEEGFPPITALPVSSGGIPPEREDFNGAMNLNSQFYFAFQNGWLPTFDNDVSTAIGGYAEGAVLWYAPSSGEYANAVVPLRSLVANNTYNFNSNSSYIGTYWGVVGINTRANLDLSNLTATGEAHFAKPDFSNVPSSVLSTLISNMMPNYANGETKQKDTEYTATLNGWVSIHAVIPYQGQNTTLVVNGETVVNYNNGYDAVTAVDIIRPIAKGDVWQVGGTNTGITVKFYPCNGGI